MSKKVNKSKMEYVEPSNYFSKEMRKILDEGKKDSKTTKKPAPKKK